MRASTLSLALRPSAASRLLPMPALRLARLLKTPEPEYGRLIRAIEDDPLFVRLSRSPQGIFSRSARPERFCWSLLEAGRLPQSSAALEGLLPDGDPAFFERLRALGRERFSRYFLGERDFDPDAAARALGLCAEEVLRIRAYVDSFLARAQAAPPCGPAPAPAPRPAVVAFIERDGDKIEARYLSAHYARGRYRIDYEKLSASKRSGVFSHAESRRLMELVRAMEAVNGKITALDAALAAAVSGQREFLLSGDRRDLRPLSQREAAAQARTSASAFCRALSARSVLAPWGAELALAAFFPSRREWLGRLVAEIAGQGDFSDEDIRGRLAQRGLRVSRRLVNLRRREFAP
ncbi:MAG: hypothetical protein HY922_11865 [Elusimicrobia bacterium]|nr:hypothetical protein [Elusimicrobiota bacterium]